jgi:hypothetical protein
VRGFSEERDSFFEAGYGHYSDTADITWDFIAIIASSKENARSCLFGGDNFLRNSPDCTDLPGG